MRTAAPRPPLPPMVGRYGVALLAVGCAAGYSAVVSGSTAVTPFILFAAAVAATAMTAGFWPSAVAVVLPAVTSDFLFLDPGTN